MVAAGGGANSGAFNFSAPNCKRILTHQLPVPPPPPHETHSAALTAGPTAAPAEGGGRVWPRAGLRGWGRRGRGAGCGRRALGILRPLGAKKAPSLLGPLSRPGKPFRGFKESITPKA